LEIHVSTVLDQLGLDYTFFVQLGIFALLFIILANVYFKPFLRLFEARHKRTVEDREAAERLTNQAEEKFEEYKRRIAEERMAARKDFEALLNETKKEEASIFANARVEAKKIGQEAMDSANKQREQLKKQLEADIEGLAKTVSETLLARRE
jgi:F0F1-type ATP synthase membrane subunit b/b'